VLRIGYLGYSSPSLERDLVGVFQQGLRSLGYVDGQNVTIEYRSAEGELVRLPAHAAKLVELNVWEHEKGIRTVSAHRGECHRLEGRLLC
jgi:putative tryptophan/tyrosine transport system substrate-binding protein